MTFNFNGLHYATPKVRRLFDCQGNHRLIHQDGHFISVKDGQKTAEGCAKLFLQNIWKPNRLPSSIISDRDPVFTSKYWAELMGRIDVQLRKNTAFHAQTDGQTERVNQSLVQYRRQYCNYEQDNWYVLLPLAEYAYKNSANTATQKSPFYANYGFHPRTTWPVEKESKNATSRNYAHWIQSVHDLCVKRLEETYYTWPNNVQNKLMYLSQGVFIAIELSLTNR